MVDTRLLATIYGRQYGSSMWIRLEEYDVTDDLRGLVIPLLRRPEPQTEPETECPLTDIDA